MEHDRQASKVGGKATGPRTRKNATSYLSSDARAVFDLQQAAGNRAVAKMLTSSPGASTVQRTPPGPTASASTSPVVQRDQFEKALEDSVDASELNESNLKEMATALVTVSKASKVQRTPRAPVASPAISSVSVQRDLFDKALSDTVEASQLGDSEFKELATALVNVSKVSPQALTTTEEKKADKDKDKTEKTGEGKKKVETATSTKIPTEEALKKREDQLRDARSPEGQRRKRWDADLKKREDELADEEKLKKDEAELKGTEKLSPLALQNKAKKEELDRLKKEKDEKEKAQKDRTEVADKLKKLKTPLTPEEAHQKMADMSMKDALDDAQQEAKDEEERRQYMRKLRKPKMTSGQAFNMWKSI